MENILRVEAQSSVYQQGGNEMKRVLISLFEWNNIANELFIVCFEKNENPPKRCLEVFSHIINVHEIWLNRIGNIHDKSLRAWNYHDHFEHALLNANNYYVTIGFLASESYGRNLEWSFEYKNHEGTTLRSSLIESYFHILSHSAYHRGQVALLLKEAGITAPETSYASLHKDLHLRVE